MSESSTHNMFDRATTMIAIVVELLIGIAAGPERRATYAIARTARRARQRSGKW
jgi:hypothetical protein